MKKILSNIKFGLELKKVKGQFGSGKKVFLFGAPYHSNMGDQAQTYCSLKWFEKYYPNYEYYSYNTAYISRNNFKLLNMIENIINKDDIIFLHSGYHTTDLYLLEENMQREVVKRFNNNKIVVLPQTILYENEAEKNKSMSIYNGHKNLLFLCRDNVSYNTANEIFKSCKKELYPDIVTTLIGTRKYTNERSGILFCMRNDKEAYYSKEEIKNKAKEIKEIDRVNFTDTTIDMDSTYISNNREKVINEILEDYSKYKVIITDRYHGTIFSLISNTPVIVLASTDHKLESGVKWFPEEFKDYVTFLTNIDELEEKITEVYSKELSYELNEYFNDNYYSKLKGIIGG